MASEAKLVTATAALEADATAPVSEPVVGRAEVGGTGSGLYSCGTVRRRRRWMLRVMLVLTPASLGDSGVFDNDMTTPELKP